MTAPLSPDIPPAESPEEDDVSMLIPAILAALSVYAIYRAARGQVEREWNILVGILGLDLILGAQLARIAGRALGRQRQDAGRERDELWAFVDFGIQDGVAAGLRTVAEALIWFDQHSPDGPVTKDSGIDTGNTSLIPTASVPPVDLARMTAVATASAAKMATAALAGWRFKTWRSMMDTRVRETHVALNGTKLPLADRFVSPSGARLRWPGDPSAPIGERVNCRCTLITSRR